MYDDIMVPTDGSDVADAAVDAALAFARRFDATVHVVHALELGELPPNVEDEGADELAHAGERAVRAAADRFEEAGVDVETAVVEAPDPIHGAVVDYAERHGVDLVVMGTHGRSGVDRFVLGSVAERTLRAAPMPVLTVHADTTVPDDLGLDGVLVATDGSDESLAAVDYGAGLAAETGADLHAIHVVDPGVVGGDVDPSLILDQLEASGERALRMAADRAREAGVEAVSSSVLMGVPYRAIVDYADENDLDCIVVGTHGRTGLDRLILGSVAEHVVRAATVPVFTVTAADERVE